MHYYEVAPLRIIRPNSPTFTYEFARKLSAGQVVAIPVGKSIVTGIIMQVVTKPSYETKVITDVSELLPIPKALVHVSSWMATYYATHLATVLQTVLPRGLTKKRRGAYKNAVAPARNRTNFVFNRVQLSALEELEAASPGTVLLHGVTGSGKTTVYIEYAKRQIAKGKSVIVLVPEIALTPQLVSEFQHHFTNIILTHSRQTEAERHLAWLEALQSTTPRIVIGPRSALFMPLASIGAIIIDEAHEPSFKQDQSPRYSALRVAGILARQHAALVIQGSATPLVSEYYLAQHNNRPIITMPHAANPQSQQAKVTLVDMTKKSHFSQHRFFSDDLLAAMRTTLAEGKQVLIFHNRRGSASTTLCEHCGWSAVCPRCFVPYTLHGDTHELRCHICDTRERVPTSCPICHSTDIIHKGIGTKLIELELKKLFPEQRVGRFDGDTHSSETVESRYKELYDGSINIIIGTQVIAKGLDLPELRLVGVIQADAGLALPDFAASERTFQLLAQVIGRVGRSTHKTSVVVQSYQPTATSVTYGIAQNYNDFYTETLAVRKQSGFPPFSYLLKLTCVYKTEAAAVRNAQSLAQTLRKNFQDVAILGPTPAFYERQRDTYRWQITVKSPRRETLLAIIASLPARGWQYDIDPASLL